ncbi:hybrid sensor histidine kinase/response regulator [Rubrivivax gelatinosus]|uniref:hybrid sensor histidine kinase/response regulator n=1 Tax=Rubrivivax gelatinosus TaxID=28068 RepID=UPI0002F3B19C|nr:ATP-binding protein [Rubrivivax gelatinosus]MBG6082200.1 signal transduction histidine kinase/CheY-like chemotaxis protein [Rubrivivax gelatinosus]
MTSDERAPAEHRVLLLTPTQRDGQIALRLLSAAGIACLECADSQALAWEIELGVGAIVMTDVAVSDPNFRLVRAALANQPDWSKVPVVLLSRERDLPWAAQRLIDELDNVTVIDRPSSLRTLLSSVQAALRGRRWQYEIRDRLVEQTFARAALQQADRRKDEFLATLSHELRNGLAPLVYNVAIGNRSLDNTPLLQELFARTGRQVHHLVRLVDDLLDVARISTGKIELSLERLNVLDIVNLALDACRAEVQRKRHRFVIVEECGTDLVVRGDRVRLTQVLSNLLSNAAKYMDAGGTITVRVAHDAGQAVVEVSDTGVGIPRESLHKVFDLFSQVRNQQAYSQGGLGIGLSLVKQLVEMQGGSVSAASDGPGRGSTFAVRLPVVEAAEPAAAAPVADGAGERPAERPLHVLVVDDQFDVASSLADMLRLEGHDVEVANNGVQALNLARGRRPDLVLLDLGMPGMDGFEVARRLRLQLDGEPRVRIVALTGWGQESDRERTKAASFDSHLVKPPAPAELEVLLAQARQASP